MHRDKILKKIPEQYLILTVDPATEVGREMVMTGLSEAFKLLPMWVQKGFESEEIKFEVDESGRIGCQVSKRYPNGVRKRITKEIGRRLTQAMGDMVTWASTSVN